MLLGLLSIMDSITSLLLPLRTVITIASLCTSMPIYVRSRLIQSPPWGKDHSRSTESFPQGKVSSFSRLAYLLFWFLPTSLFRPLNGPLCLIMHSPCDLWCETDSSGQALFSNRLIPT